MIFISYAHQDRSSASRICEALTNAGLRPWIDVIDVAPGDSFVERINDALGRSSYLVVLLSSHSLISSWVKREWMAALATQKSVLIPLRLDCSEIPTVLSDIRFIDMVSNFEAGLRELVRFFEGEKSIPLDSQPSILPGSSGVLRSLTRRQLRLLTQECLGETDLHKFLFDASIDPGRIRGGSLHERLIDLLHYASQEAILESFMEWLAIERPRCIEAQMKIVCDEQLWGLPTRRGS